MVVCMKKRRIVLGIAWIASLIGISFYGGAVSYGIFFTITLVPFLSYTYLLCVYLRFRIYQEVQSRDMICREPMPYYFVIQNSDFFAFASISIKMFAGLSFVEKVPDGIEYELLPGNRFTYTTRMVCKYCGEYDIGVKEVVLTDFFRLFTLCYQVPSTIKAIVHPRMIQLQELKSIGNLNMQISKESLQGNTELDVVVRDYVAGDAMKHIHWKASAKEQKLKTRMQIGEEKQGILFLCDTKRYSKDMYAYLPLESQMIECLLALVLYFAKQNTPASICFENQGLKQISVHGLQDYQSFYQAISSVYFEEEVQIEHMMQQLMGNRIVVQSKAVFFVVHEMNDRMMNYARDLTELGVVVVFYLVTDEDVEAYVKQSNSRICFVQVPIEADLEGVL